MPESVRFNSECQLIHRLQDRYVQLGYAVRARFMEINSLRDLEM